MMMTLVYPATLAVFVFVLVLCVPELQARSAALRRWSRSGPVTPDVLAGVVAQSVRDFATVHGLSEVHSSALTGICARPAMVPVTLLIHPTLVRYRNGRFERSPSLDLLLAALVATALLFPPATGAALASPSLWLFPLINIASFFMGGTLVRQALSDMATLNLVLTGRS